MSPPRPLVGWGRLRAGPVHKALPPPAPRPPPRAPPAPSPPPGRGTQLHTHRAAGRPRFGDLRDAREVRGGTGSHRGAGARVPLHSLLPARRLGYSGVLGGQQGTGSRGMGQGDVAQRWDFGSRRRNGCPRLTPGDAGAKTRGAGAHCVSRWGLWPRPSVGGSPGVRDLWGCCAEPGRRRPAPPAGCREVSDGAGGAWTQPGKDGPLSHWGAAPLWPRPPPMAWAPTSYGASWTRGRQGLRRSV